MSDSSIMTPILELDLLRIHFSPSACIVRCEAYMIDSHMETWLTFGIINIADVNDFNSDFQLDKRKKVSCGLIQTCCSQSEKLNKDDSLWSSKGWTIND